MSQSQTCSLTLWEGGLLSSLSNDYCPRCLYYTHTPNQGSHPLTRPHRPITGADWELHYLMMRTATLQLFHGQTDVPWRRWSTPHHPPHLPTSPVQHLNHAKVVLSSPNSPPITPHSSPPCSPSLWGLGTLLRDKGQSGWTLRTRGFMRTWCEGTVKSVVRLYPGLSSPVISVWGDKGRDRTENQPTSHFMCGSPPFHFPLPLFLSLLPALSLLSNWCPQCPV